MENTSHTTAGIKMLVKECRYEFQRSENVDYYSKEDYHEAERKYVKLCIAGLTQPTSS